MKRELFYLLLAVSILIRIFGGFVNPWTGDSITHITMATDLRAGKFNLFDLLSGKEVDCTWCSEGPYWYPPLFHIALSLVSFSYTLLKLFNPLISLITLLIFYPLMRAYIDEPSSQLATFVFAFQPFNVLITAVPYAEALLLMFVVLSLYSLKLYEVKQNERFLVLCGFSISLSILTKYSALPLFVVVPLFFILQKKFRAAAIVFLTSTLTIFPWLARNQLLFGDALHYSVNSGTLNMLWDRTINPVSGAPLLHVIRTYFEYWGIPQGDYTLLLNLSQLVTIAYVVLTLSVTSIIVKSFLDAFKRDKFSVMMLLFLSFLLFELILMYWGTGVYFRYIFPMIIPIAYFTGIKLSRMKKRHQILFLLIYILLALLTIPKFIIAREQFNELEQMAYYVIEQDKSLIVGSPHLELDVEFYFNSINLRRLENATPGDLLLTHKSILADLPPDKFLNIKETDNYVLFEVGSKIV